MTKRPCSIALPATDFRGQFGVRNAVAQAPGRSAKTCRIGPSWAILGAIKGRQAAGIAGPGFRQCRIPLVVCDTKQPMTLDAAQHRSGKGAGDENFPVASWLVTPPNRRPIMAFYEFVRTPADIADHPTLGATGNVGHPNGLEPGLLGRNDHN